MSSPIVSGLTPSSRAIVLTNRCFAKIGGPVQMVDSFPGDFFIGPNMSYPIILIGTFIAFLPKQTISIMNMHESFRYLTAKDSINARKACLLALILMGVGSIIWFIPAWSSASLYPDAAVAYAELGSKAADAVYLEFARNAMPIGTVGLLMAGLFAATMSSMDSALNKNAGIFVRSIYEPFLVKRNRPASDRKLLFMGKAVSLFSGSIVIGMALLFAAMKGMDLLR